MADYDLKAKVTADTSGYKAGVDNVVSYSKKLSSTLASVGLALNGLTSSFKLISGAVKTVTKTVTDCTNAFKIQLNAEKALDNAVKNSPLMNGQSAKNFKDFASTIQSATNYGDEQVLPLITQLTTLGRSEKETMEIVKVATDMAATGTISLETAVNQLNATMNGNIGRLGLQNAELKDLTAEELKNGKAVEILGKKYKGMAQAVIDPSKQLKNLTGDLKETIGSKLYPTVQTFTIDAIKSVQKIIDIVQELNIDRIGAVLRVVLNDIKNLLSEIGERFINVGNNIKKNMSNIDLSPLISVLDTIFGLLFKIKDLIINNFNSVISTISKFKDIFSGIISNTNIKKIADYINLAIDAFVFLYKEVNKIFEQFKSTISKYIIKFWNIIKDLFEASNKALANSETDIQSWGDFFYSQFNNIFRIVQDMVQSISAILRGDWKVAWEYAKLSVLRAVDNILDGISTMLNAFPGMVNKFIDQWNKFLGLLNKGRKKIGMDEIELVPPFEKIDLSGITGVENKIKEVENTISELTGKTADKNLKDIERFSTGAQGKLSGFIDTFVQKIDDAEKENKDIADKYVSDIAEAVEDAEDDIEEANDNGEKDSKKTAQNIAIAFINTAKSIGSSFKKVADTFKNVLSGIGNFVKNTFDKLKNIFSTLFDFNIDDALNNLLKIEDAILTFFVETLPRLSNFFESAFSSVLTLIQTLINSIDWDNIKNILDSIIKTFVTYAPQIMSGIVEIFTNLVSTVSSVLVENAPEIVSAIGQMFFTILEALPGLISNFLKVAGTYLSEIGKYITDNSERFTKDLTDIVSSIVEGISNFIESGGWKNILSAILTIQKAIENAVTENLPTIVDTIIEALPDLIQFLIDSIVSASKNITKVIKPIIKLILAVIEALVDVLTSDEVLDAGLEAFMEFIEIFTDEILPMILEILPKLISKILKFIGRNFTKIVKSIVQGLVKAFRDTDWGNVIKQMFTGFIDAFKDLFGIHSPSTLFEEFGLYMVEGLVNGLKGISEATMMIIQPFVDLLENAFGGVISGIVDSVKSIVEGFVTLSTSSFDAVKDIVDVLVNANFDTLKTAIESVTSIFKTLSELTFSSIVDLTKLSFNTLKDSINNTTTALKDITQISLKNLSNTLTSLTSISFNGLNSSISAVSSGLRGIANVSFSGLTNSINAVSSGVVAINNSITSLIKSLSQLVSVASQAVSALNPLSGGSSGSSAKTALVDLLVPFGFLQHFATGTQQAQKGMAIVGEAGPELVRFNGGEQVINNRNTQKVLAGMNGGTNNFNVTFNNLQDTSVFAMMNQLKQYNRQMAINGVI